MSESVLAERLRESLVSSVENASESKAIEVARKCLEEKVPAEKLVKSISDAFSIIGSKYEKGVYYLPELIFAGTIAQNVLKILGPILSSGASGRTGGKVVIGTVRGDIHDLGKNIVSLMLEPEGFEVIDLGNDVAPERFVDAVASEKAGILCMSALLSTTRVEMRGVIEELSKRRLRDKVMVLVGGGAVDPSFAKEIGADAYGKDAIEAVKLCKRFARS